MPARPSLAVAVCVLAGLLLPAVAGAATATVTDDAGAQAQLVNGGSVQVRHMAPVVTPALAPEDKRFTLVITGPDGKSAGVDAVCVSASSAGPQKVTYAGNGAYAVRLVTYSGADDIYCAGAASTQSFTVVIAASVTVKGPTSPVLYRAPGGAFKDFTFTYDVGPGADAYKFVWAYDAKFGAGGAIVGDYPRGDYHERGSGNPDGTLSGINFPRAGIVSVVVGAGSGNATSPFSAPLVLKLIGPFDWSESPGLTGSRGATFTIGAEVREPGAVGRKVSVLLAKGSGKFRPFVSRTIPSSRKLSFKIRKPRGRYRLKYVFKGADLVAAGAWTQSLRIGKGNTAGLSRLALAAG